MTYAVSVKAEGSDFIAGIEVNLAGHFKRAEEVDGQLPFPPVYARDARCFSP